VFCLREVGVYGEIARCVARFGRCVSGGGRGGRMEHGIGMECGGHGAGSGTGTGTGGNGPGAPPTNVPVSRSVWVRT